LNVSKFLLFPVVRSRIPCWNLRSGSAAFPAKQNVLEK